MVERASRYSAHSTRKNASLLPTEPYCNTQVCFPFTSSILHTESFSSLYHTVNILLHRPLLSKRSSPHTDRKAVIECLTSASAITIIFELFSTTFGHGYSIMALSYSLYMAASIFLLQVQAVKPSDPRMVERLRFCINSLESVSTVNAGMFHLRPHFGLY
jgi:hypothetical protein